MRKRLKMAARLPLTPEPDTTDEAGVVFAVEMSDGGVSAIETGDEPEAKGEGARYDMGETFSRSAIDQGWGAPNGIA